MRLEPQNQEIKKQYAEAKSLYQKVLFTFMYVSVGFGTDYFCGLLTGLLSLTDVMFFFLWEDECKSPSADT